MENLIKDMEIVDQPLVKLGKVGPLGLKDSELLAIVLGLKSLGQADKILADRTLAGLAAMPAAQLKKLRGVGKARADVFACAYELFTRADHARVNDAPTFNSMNDIVGQSVELREKKKEHLLAFFLNARNQLIAKETISIGTLTASLAHPREIFTPAIGKSAAGVILVHNHPSGDPSPSDEDVRLTKRITQAGHIMGIELLDHLIVAENGCYSFKQAGCL